MTNITELEPLSLGKGCQMRFFFDTSTSPPIHWTETTYDDAADSWIPVIPEHWHKYHDEYMTVLNGSIEFTVDGKKVIKKKGDETFTVKRRTVHGFKFLAGEGMVTLKEVCNPPGDYKEAFFRDMFQRKNAPDFFLAMRSFYDGDTYVHLPGPLGYLDEPFMMVAGGLAKWIAPVKPTLAKSDRTGKEALVVEDSSGTTKL